MNLRSNLQQQAAQHQLDETALARLYQLAGLNKEPFQIIAHWRTGCAVAGAALVGIGIIQWVAANWLVFGRFGRIGLAELFILAPMLTLIWRPAWRVPMGIMAMLGSGATLACIGQTYPTGAESWQLFALWATLNAPLCYAIRSDALWVLWAIIANTAATLVIQQMTWTWNADATYLHAQLMALSVIAATTALFRLPLRDKIGSGKWTAACSLLLATLSVCTAMIGSLPSHERAPYWFGLVLLVAACLWLSSKRYVDSFGLCIIFLAINVELDAGFVEVAWEGEAKDFISVVLGSSFVAAGILVGSIFYVRWVLDRVKESGDE